MSKQRRKPRWDPSKRWPPEWPSAPPGTDPRTLEEIDGMEWEGPPFATDLVRTCHALRLKPLGSFSVEDLRILIGQSESLPVLVPLALIRLQEDPLVEGDCYPGDLLRSVLELEASYWQLHPGEHREVREVAERALAALDERNEPGWATGDMAACVREFLER
jgi:hypothetical protein